MTTNLPCTRPADGQLPAELRELPQWVGWRLRRRAGTPKPTKQPLNPRDGALASTTDPGTWGTFEEALNCPGADGIGFVFTNDDPYVGVDLDGCRNPETGALEQWAAEIIAQLKSYTEVSPSGTGVHVIVRGILPGTRRRKGPIETYAEGRYFTMTGNYIPETSAEIADRSSELRALHEVVFGDSKAVPAQQRAVRQQTAERLAGVGLRLDSAAAPPADKWLALCENDPRVLKTYRRQRADLIDKSASSYDMALASFTVAAGWNDQEIVDLLIAGRRDARDDLKLREDYYVRTIAKARSSITPTSPVDGADMETGHSGFALTDYGNAERLVARHGADLRYVMVWGQWLCWDGIRWQHDRVGLVMQRAKDTVRVIYQEAADEPDKVLREATAKWAKQSESQVRLEAMIALAQTEPGIGITVESLDSNPWALNVENGTLDLRTGDLRPHERDDLITRLAPVVFDPDAESEVLTRFLERVLPDPELREFVQRAVGYSLVGEPLEDVMFFVHGPTRTGKSTFIESIRATLGDYALVSDFEAFVKRRNTGGPRNDIARLVGARLVVSVEVEDGQELAVALVKTVTGGDRVTARLLYKEAFEFTPQFTIWIASISSAPYRFRFAVAIPTTPSCPPRFSLAVDPFQGVRSVPATRVEAVNAAWNARFASGIPASTPLIRRCLPQARRCSGRVRRFRGDVTARASSRHSKSKSNREAPACAGASLWSLLGSKVTSDCRDSHSWLTSRWCASSPTGRSSRSRSTSRHPQRRSRSPPRQSHRRSTR